MWICFSFSSHLLLSSDFCWCPRQHFLGVTTKTFFMFGHLDAPLNPAVEQNLLPQTPPQNESPVSREQDTKSSAGLNELCFITVINLHQSFSPICGRDTPTPLNTRPLHTPREGWSHSIPGGLPAPARGSSEQTLWLFSGYISWLLYYEIRSGIRTPCCSLSHLSKQAHSFCTMTTMIS